MLTDKYLKYYKSEKVSRRGGRAWRVRPRWLLTRLRCRHTSTRAHAATAAQIQNTQPIGLLFLRSVSKIDRGVEGPGGMIDAFALTTPERTFVFSCQNDREVRSWLDAVKPYIKVTNKVAEVVKNGFLTKQGGSFKVRAGAHAHRARAFPGSRARRARVRAKARLADTELEAAVLYPPHRQAAVLPQGRQGCVLGRNHRPRKGHRHRLRPDDQGSHRRARLSGGGGCASLQWRPSLRIHECVPNTLHAAPPPPSRGFPARFLPSRHSTTTRSPLISSRRRAFSACSRRRRKTWRRGSTRSPA